MKSLMLHCKEFESVITGLATRPAGIVPDKVTEIKQSLDDCILAFVTIEKGDSAESAQKMSKEIGGFCSQTKHRNVFLCPFAHLSNNLASCGQALPLLKAVVNNLREEGLVVAEGHFGSDKELLIRLYGHAGNARYREF